MFPRQASDETIANLKQKADSIWKLATSGADFAELARKYSDDKQSAPNGGVMNWFSSTTMVPEFAEAAFALKKDGDISPVIRTPYGWHIIRRLEWKPVQSFEKMKPDIENRIKQNPDMAKYSDEAFDRKLSQDYGLKTDEATFGKLANTVADSLHVKNWAKIAEPFKGSQIVAFAGRSFSVGDFAGYLQEQHFAGTKKYSETELKAMLESFIHQQLLAYEDTQLEKKYPDFARTYQEYHDGILLFNISKDKIWDVASNDTARLENYFAHTNKKYYWNDRFKGWVIQAKTPDIRIQVETLLDTVPDMEMAEPERIFNSSDKNNLQLRQVAVEKGDDPVVDYYIWSGPKPAQFDETTTFVHGKIVHNELKDLKDAWGLYSSDFQDQVEKEWMASLRNKYPVVINKKALKKIPVVE
jgi:peptidyl-prolyl cis-trans isomerase SurA